MVSSFSSVVDRIKRYQNTGSQESLDIVPAADATVALLDPEDIDNVGAHLLASEDPSPSQSSQVCTQWT